MQLFYKHCTTQAPYNHPLNQQSLLTGSTVAYLSYQHGVHAGMRDVFKFKASDIGDVERIIIWHDNSGIGPDWHLEQASGMLQGSMLKKNEMHKPRLHHCICLQPDLQTYVLQEACPGPQCSNCCQATEWLMRIYLLLCLACWHCTHVCVQVEITHHGTGKTTFFPCNDWLKKVGTATGMHKYDAVAFVGSTAQQTHCVHAGGRRSFRLQEGASCRRG